MGIQGMRNGIRNHRVWIIVLFVLLVISLLWAYSVGMFTGGRGQSGEVDVDAMIANYEAAIAERRTALEADPDNYATVKSLADTLSNYAYVRGTYAVGTEDEVAAFYKEAADLYMKAVEVRPADLNATGLSDIYASLGVSYYGARDVENTEKYFDLAVETDPSNPNAVFSKIQYLMMNKKYAEALEVVEAFQALVGEDDANYATAEQYRLMFEDVLRLQAENAEKAESEGENAEGEKAEGAAE